MRIEQVTKDTIGLWSNLWQEQEKSIEGSYIRPMDEAYFEKKYQRSEKMKGYCIREGENEAAFFGIEYKSQDELKLVSFCDFIRNPDFRGKGIFTEMIKLIREELFTDGEVLVFHPINRQAMISWKFALNPSVTFRQNRFLIGMKKEEKEDSHYSFLKEQQELKPYLKKMTAIRDGNKKAVLLVNEIYRDQIKGLEVCEIQGMEEKELPELFTGLFSWMAQEDYGFCMVKVSEQNDFQEWLENLQGYQKEKEILYQFYVCEEKQVTQIKEWNPVVIGESLDIPREDGLIRKFQKKVIHIQTGGEENGGAHEG